MTFGTKSMYEKVVTAAEQYSYDPVQNYLRDLKWDGVDRLGCGSLLLRYAGCADTRYHRAVGLMWPISAVARALDPGCKVDTMLILQGGQGENKSQFWSALCPDQRWFTDHISSLSVKDSKQELSGRWIIELAELSALKRTAEVETVKAFIPIRFDKYRPPYGYVVQEFARHCVFGGSTNEDLIFKDTTGNRRFWPVVVGKMDVDALIRDRDQLWAEAVVLYQSGNKWWLTVDEDVELFTENRTPARSEARSPGRRGPDQGVPRGLRLDYIRQLLAPKLWGCLQANDMMDTSRQSSGYSKCAAGSARNYARGQSLQTVPINVFGVTSPRIPTGGDPNAQVPSGREARRHTRGAGLLC